MNALVNYASDSDSEDEEPLVVQPKQHQHHHSLQQHGEPSHADDDFLLSALRDIQDFAALIDDDDTPPEDPSDPDLERRLLEFAIRMVDWEKGGLYEAYFLGKERANVILACQQGTLPDHVELPTFGGIVGSILNHLHHLEHMAAPLGWTAVWDVEDEAYGFQHSRTGTYSPVYPSQELVHYLDPPSLSSSQPPLSVQSRSYFMSRPAPSPIEASSPSVAQDPWSQAQPSTSEITSPAAVSKTPVSKIKKRKAEGGMSDRVTDEAGFNDQHIHPSRRAILSGKPTTTPPASTTPHLGSSSSKQMPKKLASLLQKWSEKDKEESDEDEHEQDYDRREYRHEHQGKQDSQSSSVPMTGANSQSLGGDWRDRRLRPK
ncbi:hypothetical protein BGX31_000496 [Mortierella sp. GBA43]|nr:hypothetical protein BGX31_000496 [Mortierella sp. GBA43]